METKAPGCFSVLGIFLLFTCFSLRTEAVYDSESFQQKVLVLQKVLLYINDRSEQMNLDVLFGIVLTEANLLAALLHENTELLEHKFIIELKKLIRLTDLTRRNLMSTVVSENKSKHLILKTLGNLDLWIKPIIWKDVIFHRSSYEKPSYEKILESIHYGTPTEKESDQCLYQIIRSYLGQKENLEYMKQKQDEFSNTCNIPSTCVEILMKDDNTTGYPLTHRLLILQLADALGCKEMKTTLFSSLISIYCGKIFKELLNLEMWNFPNVARDLMMEQIVLCGMEGYNNFLSKNYEDIIVNWPQWSGCFSINESSNKHKIVERLSLITNFNCNSHTTTLAAATLALFIRESIENGFENEGYKHTYIF